MKHKQRSGRWYRSLNILSYDRVPTLTESLSGTLCLIIKHWWHVSTGGPWWAGVSFLCCFWHKSPPPPVESNRFSGVILGFPFARIIIAREQEDSPDRLQSANLDWEISWKSLVSDELFSFYFWLSHSKCSLFLWCATYNKDKRELLEGPVYKMSGWDAWKMFSNLKRFEKFWEMKFRLVCRLSAQS